MEVSVMEVRKLDSLPPGRDRGRRLGLPVLHVIPATVTRVTCLPRGALKRQNKVPTSLEAGQKEGGQKEGRWAGKGKAGRVGRHTDW